MTIKPYDADDARDPREDAGDDASDDAQAVVVL